MPLHTRLLTFDQLPNRQLVGDLSPLTQVYEQLDSTSAFFENCYLQSPGLQSVLGHVEAVSAIPALLAKQNESAVFVQLGETAQPMDQGSVPSWLQQKLISRPQEMDSVSKGCGLVWLHCHLTMLPETADGDATTFNACLQALRGLDSGCGSPLVITALNGVNAPDDLPFESHLFDSQIRVPLWVETEGRECRRVQPVAGSFDVLETVWRTILLGGDVQPSMTAEDQSPQCLLKLIAESGHPSERRLLLRAEDAVAIRTESFLFVQGSQTVDDGEVNFSDCALYTKPADVWNVHDVSAEYHELVNEFSRQVAHHIR